ncbi:MAG: hypothetical protein JJE04_17400 [Acidobacteriia bacterium]|nr:hypothetical protein [Terriglobia bacterium]
MPEASPVPSLTIASGGELRVVAYLRELRPEIQNLREGLQKVKTASEMAAPEAKALLVAECLESKARFDRNKDAVVGCLIAIEHVFQDNEALHAQYGDTLAEITNKWDNAAAHWPTGAEEAAKLTGRIKEVDAEMVRIVYLCALLTVPERVNRNLDAMRVGQAMDFRMSFLDEISNDGHQRKLLDFLGQHPKLVNGVVDPDAGLFTAAVRVRQGVA